MATATTSRMHLTHFNKTGDIELPVGMWLAAATWIFDASGGDAVNTFGAGNRAISEAYLWSVEDVQAWGVAAGAKNIQIFVNTFENIGGLGFDYNPNRILVVGNPLTATGAVSQASTNQPWTDRLIFQPYGYEWTLRGTWITQLPAESGVLQAWGYIWDRDARMRGRGPRRP